MEASHELTGRTGRMASASPMRRFVKTNQKDFGNSYESAQKRVIRKWIKHNDVSQLVGANQQYIDPRKDDTGFVLDEKKEVSTNLTLLRRKFDEVHDQCAKKEAEITNMRADIEKFKAEEELITGDGSSLARRFEQLRNAVETQKLKLEEAALSKASYEHLLERMKRDQIAFKMKHNSIEKALNERNLELSHANEDSRKAKQIQQQSKYFLDELMKNVSIEKKKREESLMIFKHTIKQRQEAEKKREDRIKRTQDIADNAVNETRNNNQQKWRQLYMVHKFVSLFLKRKMEREMGKYKTIEQAFQKIKASTGLSDAREIVNRFVNREQTYSDLLLSIADYERKIDTARKICEELKDKIHNLTENVIPQEKAKIHGSTGNRQDIISLDKELAARNERFRKYKLLLDKSYSWAIRMLQKLQKLDGTVKFNFYDMYPRENMLEAVMKVIEMCKVYIEQTQSEKEEIPVVLDELERIHQVDAELKDETFLSKNVRVKPSPTKRGRAHSEDNSVRSHSQSRDMSDVTGESGVEEDDYDPNLEQTHMEELRKKYKAEEAEELRKKRIQMLKKKAEEDAENP
mmetsp:Transcript_7870/g.8855  ORF Transcript_7870/g.8855 Transcript_7870/m.8855 type:complete len:575 (+) Transcript_7870:29-1753(+)